jgi:hypothetical protein
MMSLMDRLALCAIDVLQRSREEVIARQHTRSCSSCPRRSCSSGRRSWPCRSSARSTASRRSA